MTSWCDKLASTPVMGLRFAPSFVPVDTILGALRPILDREVDGERLKFNIEQHEAFAVAFNTDSGFRYSVDQYTAAVTFNHRIRAKTASAGPPIMELISSPAPYTQLLENVAERLIELTHLLGAVKGKSIKRVGVVSQTTVQLEDAPPGIGQLFEEVGQPFGGSVDSFNVAITTILDKTDERVDRCIHTLGLPEDEDKLVNIQLDWQRSFLEPKNISGNLLKAIVDSAKADALAYYERVAEGGLADGIDSGS